MGPTPTVALMDTAVGTTGLGRQSSSGGFILVAGGGMDTDTGTIVTDGMVAGVIINGVKWGKLKTRVISLDPKCLASDPVRSAELTLLPTFFRLFAVNRGQRTIAV